MSTPLTKNTARLVDFTVPMTDGTSDTTTTATISSGNAAIIRATINPDNPRQFAVVGLTVQAAPVSVSLLCGGKTTSADFQVVAPAIASVALGTIGPEITPPAWALPTP